MASKRSQTQARSDALHSKRYNIKLNLVNDADIIGALELADSKQAFIKEAIRAYIKK